MNAFSYPSKRGINFAKIRGFKVTDYRGRLPALRAGLFRCSREPCVSLPRRSRARRPHSFQTASLATLHYVPRPMALADSQPPPTGPPIFPAAVRLPAP